MQSQELDLELLTYGERNVKLISSIRNELALIHSFNSSSGGYGAGYSGNITHHASKRQSGEKKTKKKVSTSNSLPTSKSNVWEKEIPLANPEAMEEEEEVEEAKVREN
jgi:hypothetical protein